VFPNVPLASSRVPDQATEIAKFFRLQGVSEALFRTRTGDPLLTMEVLVAGARGLSRAFHHAFPASALVLLPRLPFLQEP
jgi:hypothetical protein